MVVGGAGGVDCARLERGADLWSGGGSSGGLAVDGHSPGVGGSSPRITHGRRLAGAVGPQEPCHDPRLTVKVTSSTAVFSP